MNNIQTEIVLIWLRNDEEMSKVYNHIANKKTIFRLVSTFKCTTGLTNYERADILKSYIYTLCMGEDAEINGKAEDLVCNLVNNALNSIDYMELIKAEQGEI